MTTSQPHTPSTELPLNNVRVIDFSRLLPGPWCTQTLGDLGADVIKIEQPEIGDYARHNPPTFKTMGVYFNSINRNKRSVVLDLTVAEDREAAYKLIDRADIGAIPQHCPVRRRNPASSLDESPTTDASREAPLRNVSTRVLVHRLSHRPRQQG